MLRKTRVLLASLFFVLVTLLFLDFTGTAHRWLGWMAKVQLVPAILAVNVGIVVFLVLLTLLLGRVYCSVICPLGVFQDVVSRVAGRFQKKNRFSYSPALTWLRVAVLVIFIVALAAHLSYIAVLIEPYSAYGRIASNLFAPIYREGNNLLAWFAERADSYAFYPVEVWIKSGITFGMAVLTFVVIGILAWRNGRTYCNTVCPVGTALGYLSKFSLLKPRITADKCNGCSLCARICKASCIDHKNHTIDYTRCVACMNCIDVCRKDAIVYGTATKTGDATGDTPAGRPSARSGKNPVTTSPAAEILNGKITARTAADTLTDTANGNGMSRRGFLSVVGMLALAKAAKAEKVADGGLAVIEDKKIPDRGTPVVPPGSRSAKNMKIHCTACQLCVSACPNNILRPSSKLDTFMQPEMSFERGYCRPECVRCSEVCPNNAIHRIDPAEKSSIQIGRAVWIADNCVVNRDEVTCTACQRHCPTGAIELIARSADEKERLKIPVVDTSICIGCGACENLCPARPFSAIYVEGNQIHRTI